MEKVIHCLKYFISCKLFFCKPINGPWKKGKHKPMKNFSGETSFVLSNLLSVCCSFLTDLLLKAHVEPSSIYFLKNSLLYSVPPIPASLLSP